MARGMNAFNLHLSDSKVLPVHEAHVRVKIDINSFFGIRIPLL
jgi:hypothetical protein